MKKGAERSESIAIAYKFLNKIEDSPEMAQELWIKLESFKIKPGEFVSFRIDGKILKTKRIGKNGLKNIVMILYVRDRMKKCLERK